MNFKKIILIILLTTVGLLATETKKISKEFEVTSDQLVEFNGVSGLNVKMLSWDKNSVKIDLNIKVKSSDKEYEKKYIKEFDVEEWSTSTKLQIDIKETDDEGGWNFLDIFSLKFGFSIEKDISGEIYLPANNPLIANIRYSTIELKNMVKEVQILGRSDEIKLDNCANVTRIENQYGETTLSNTGGNLQLESRSADLKISNHKGDLNLDADYCNSIIDGVDGNLILDSRSDKITVKNVTGNANINTDYSQLTVENISGMVEINNRSGKLDLSNVGGLKFVGNYTPITIKTITGKASNNIYLETRSANIKISDAAGNMKIDDSYSNFDFKNIKGGITITSRSGSIIGDNIEGDWYSDTKYCSLELTELSAKKIFVNNNSGKIEITNKVLPQKVEIENEYDAVVLTLPKGYAGSVNLETKYGKIQSEVPVKINADNNSVTASNDRPASDPMIKIKNRSGDIILKEK